MSQASAIEARKGPFFDPSSVPPPGGSTEFSLHLWEKVKSRGISPSSAGLSSDDIEKRLDFLTGARLYGLELVDLDDQGELDRLQAMRPPRFPIQPQQLLIVDTLNAEYDQYAVEVPRRASKTTTIFCLLLGRCARRPGYQVTFSAQSGVAGSRRLREWANRLDAVNPPDDADLPPWMRGKARTSKQAQRAVALFGDELIPVDQVQQGRGFRILKGEVGKGIYFDNTSQLLVLKPDADSYRGEAADVSWLDEAQEIDPDEGADLLAGIVPLQDTRDDSAIVISGTAGEARLGPFWEHLDRLRNGDTDMGGLDFAAAEDVPWELIDNKNPANEDYAIQLLRTVHPGIDTLTTEEKMRKNWRKLPTPQWAREYLSIWPETFGTLAVPADQWLAGALSKKLPRPTRVAFGMDIKPGGSVAAIVAAWRNARGVAYIEVVEHRQGTAWIPERAQELTQRYRGSTIAFDDIAEGKATATEMLTLRPAPRLKMQTYRENAAGCVQLLRDLERGKLKHFDQVGLNEATNRAAKREVRGDQGVWLWTISQPGDDITCLAAATRALRNWDQHFAGRSSGYKPVMGD